MSKNFAILLCGLVAVIVVGAPAVRAQTVYGSIVGTVTDASGGAISGAKVTLTNAGTNERRDATADAAGNYQFLNLLPGDYTIAAWQEKYGSTEQKITVGPKDAKKVDFVFKAS